MKSFSDKSSASSMYIFNDSTGYSVHSITLSHDGVSRKTQDVLVSIAICQPLVPFPAQDLHSALAVQVESLGVAQHVQVDYILLTRCGCSKACINECTVQQMPCMVSPPPGMHLCNHGGAPPRIMVSPPPGTICNLIYDEGPQIHVPAI